MSVIIIVRSVIHVVEVFTRLHCTCSAPMLCLVRMRKNVAIRLVHRYPGNLLYAYTRSISSSVRRRWLSD